MQNNGGKSRRGGAAFGLACALLIAAAWIGTTTAAPIRVGIYKGVGPGRFWHTCIHTAGAQIASILANPDSANIGPNLIHAPDGFTVSSYGVSGTTQGNPTADQLQAFIAALDTLDVVVIPSFTYLPDNIADSASRARFETFAKTKGFVSIHATTDDYGGTWAIWDSIHGTRFANHPSSDRQATVHLDTLANSDPQLGFLNRGLPDSARFLEEWFSFTSSASSIRATSGLRVTVNIDENSYGDSASTNRLGGATAMGSDHPLSWYRTFPEGGRFFYTAIGHRAQSYRGIGTTPDGVYFLRRQIYNAILWAARVDSNGVVSLNNGKVEKPSPSRFADHARLSLSGGSLTVTLLRGGAHTVEIRALDGRRVALQTSAQRGDMTFNGLPSGVHLVAIRAAEGTATRLVRVP